MSTDATAITDATKAENTNSVTVPEVPSPAGKGKGKIVQEDVMDEDEDEEDDADEEVEDEDEEMAEEEDYEEIDPSVIQSRRTRGVRVDYASAEALQKAGLKPEEPDTEDVDQSFTPKDD